MAIKKTVANTTKENIETYDIVDHLEQSFIDYSMSVITDRAIPDVRDGCKPSQRKGLFTMRNMKLTSDKKSTKQQAVLGRAMETIYVHADSGLKGAIDRMAQFWVVRETLVYPDGSVGTPDSTTEAAAPRYLEVKLTKHGDLMTDLLNKNVVDMMDNYDGTMKEPEVLTSLFPNILVNPSSGIAVGMATSIPSHNMIEACDAVIAYLKNNNITVEELLSVMPGPDFPLGGMIVNQDDMLSCYKTGKGKAIVRGIPVVDKNTITFKEIPYGVSTDKLVDKINELIENEKIIGIEEAFDNTGINKTTKQTEVGIEIIMEKGADVNNVLEQLYASTPLQNNVSFNMMALVNRVPKLLSLKEILKHYSDHLCSVHRRSLEHDLRKEEHDLHILLGFRKALANIDDVVKTIRSSKGKTDGLPKLMELLNVDMEQAEAIWNRRLGSLSNMDIEKVEEDITSTEKEIEKIKNLLVNLVDYVIASLNEIKKLGTPRRTKLTNIDLSYQKAAKAKASKPEIPEEQIIVVFNKTTGVIKQMKRGAGFKCSNLDFLYLFTEQGSLIKIQGHELPSDDKSTIEVMDMNDKVVSFIQFSGTDNIYHFTKNGNVKGTKGIEYINVSKKNTNSIKLKTDDIVTDVIACNDKVQSMKITTSTDDIVTLKVADISIGGKLTSGRQRIKFDKNEAISKIELMETVE